ncbi:MAG TPA: L-threonylcarbamoyladenylate synthase [Bacillota bacterium]
MTVTKRWNVKGNLHNKMHDIEEAAHMLRKGFVVAFPTETVYGLGADATNEEAVSKVFQAKGRPQDNPLIVHVATKRQLTQLVRPYAPYVDRLIDTLTPGPITFVLRSNHTCADNVTAGLSTIAVRIPDHPVAQALLTTCDFPVAAPSANLSGKPSPTTADHVWEDLQGRIAGVLDGGPTGLGVESTVIDCTGKTPVILRPGGITKESLETIIGDVIAKSTPPHTMAQPKSPGMKYKHYEPEVPLWLIDGSIENLKQTIDQQQKSGLRVGLLASNDTVKHVSADVVLPLGESIQDIAANLYDRLRSFTKDDVDLIVCETFPREGLGQAVMNRLMKAASNYIEQKEFDVDAR